MTTEEEFRVAPAKGSSAGLDAARRDVARAHAKFSTDLQRASSAGRTLTTKIVNGARPALIGVAAVTGVALIVTVWRARARRPQLLRSRAHHSVSAGLGRTAMMTLASIAGRLIAAKLVTMAQTALESSTARPVTADSDARSSVTSKGRFA